MSIVVRENARFTVMCEGVVRIEYAENGAFEDSETLFAKRDAECDAVVDDGEILRITTPKLTLYYTGGEFSAETLYADANCGPKKFRWHYGDENKENLHGTLATLDGVDGFRPLPEGLIARDGWHVIDDSCSAVMKDGWVENRSESHLVDKYLFVYGDDYKGALRDLASVSGSFKLPRKCFFGSWYSRWWDYSADEFLEIIDGYDKNGYPLDVLVMDMDWHIQDWSHKEGDPEYLYGYGHAGGNLGWTGYRWNRRLIPDPDAFLAEVRGRGIDVTLNDHPCDGVRDTDEVYPSFLAELEGAGYTESVPDVAEHIKEKETANLCRNVKNYRFNAGSRDYMKAFFNATRKEMEERGAEFRWLDWQQDRIYPFVNGVKGLTHLKWLNHLYYENSRTGGKRGLGFSRWGGFGDHKHPAYFSGDSVTSWETLDFEVQMTVSAGNAGCFWWSHDIGGFQDPIPGGQAEVFVRWVQFGAMSAALRVHMCGTEGLDRRPWTWGEPYASAMKRAYRLRSELMPYIYSSAYKSTAESVPFLRPLYYDWKDEEAYAHPRQYLLGEGLMVCPVCTPMDESGRAVCQVWIPDGIWYDYFTGEKYTKGTYDISCPLDTFPLFVRAGYPVVRQPYASRRTKAPLENATVVIYAGENGSSELYEDDGVTEDGGYRLTSVTYTERDGEYTVSLRPEGTGYEGEVLSRDITVEIRGISASGAVCHGFEVEVEAGESFRATVRGVPADKEISIVIR